MDKLRIAFVPVNKSGHEKYFCLPDAEVKTHINESSPTKNAHKNAILLESSLIKMYHIR